MQLCQQEMLSCKFLQFIQFSITLSILINQDSVDNLRMFRNILGAHQCIPELLRIFSVKCEHTIHVVYTVLIN